MKRQCRDCLKPTPIEALLQGRCPACDRTDFKRRGIEAKERRAPARKNPHVRDGAGYIGAHSPSGKPVELHVVRHHGAIWSADGSPLPEYVGRVVHSTKAEAKQAHADYGCPDCARKNPAFTQCVICKSKKPKDRAAACRGCRNEFCAKTGPAWGAGSPSCTLAIGHPGRCFHDCMFAGCTHTARKNPRASMTYGVLPKRQAFADAFDSATEGRSTYDMVVKGKHPKEVATGDYTEDQLWEMVKALKRAWENGDEDAGDWASGILTTLGFEWI